MTYISVGLRILLSIAFLGAGCSKLAGVEMMVMTNQIRWGQGFHYLTGAIEVIGVALLWLPRRFNIARTNRTDGAGGLG